MDGIQAYKGDAAPPSTSRPAIAPARCPRSIRRPSRSTSNYLAALKRRFWVVLAVAVPMAITTSILALKQPPVYVVEGRDRDQPAGRRPLAIDPRRDREAAAANHRARPTTSPPAKFDSGNRSSKSESSTIPSIAPKVSQLRRSGIRACSKTSSS